MLARHRRTAHRPSIEPAMPRSTSHTRERRVCARPRPRTRLSHACHKQTQRSGRCSGHRRVSARRQSRPEVKGPVDSPRLVVHSHTASHGGDGEQVCGGVEGRIGHLRGQDQQKRAAGSMRVPATGSAWAATGTATGCTPFRCSGLPMFSLLPQQFFLSSFLTRCELRCEVERR